MNNDAQLWIEDMGGKLCANGMVIAWCHDDSQPSAKLYNNERVHCFACGKTFYAPWSKGRGAKSRITLGQYVAYRKATGIEWPTIQEVEAWTKQDCKD